MILSPHTKTKHSLSTSAGHFWDGIGTLCGRMRSYSGMNAAIKATNLFVPHIATLIEATLKRAVLGLVQMGRCTSGLPNFQRRRLQHERKWRI